MSKSFIFFLHAENFGLRKPCSSEIVPNPIRNVHSGAKSMQRLGERERACVYFYISLPLISFFLSPVPSLFVIPFARAFFFFPARAAMVFIDVRCQRHQSRSRSSMPAPKAVERRASEYYCSCCLLVESSSGFFCRIAWNTHTFSRVRLSYLVSVRLRSIFF